MPLAILLRRVCAVHPAPEEPALNPRPSSLAPAFTWPIRVYWEDTDAGGVVYHASYLRFLERARTEWLRAQGVEQQRVRNEDGVVFVVRDLEIEFFLPARLDDELDVTVESGEWRSASMTFVQRIVRRVDGAVVAGARVRAACIDAATFKPCRIPNHLFTENPMFAEKPRA